MTSRNLKKNMSLHVSSASSQLHCYVANQLVPLVGTTWQTTARKVRRASSLGLGGSCVLCEHVPSFVVSLCCQRNHLVLFDAAGRRAATSRSKSNNSIGARIRHNKITPHNTKQTHLTKTQPLQQHRFNQPAKPIKPN